MASSRGPDNSVRVSVQGTIGSVNWANVFHCQLTSSGSVAQADLDSWTTSFGNAYKTAFATRQATGLNYGLCKTVLFTPGGGELISSAVMTGAGTSAGTILPDSSSCKVISWFSTVYWRGGKPRTYIGGMVTSDTNGPNLVSAAEITALQAAAATFRTAINALAPASITSTALGFVSFRSGNALRPAPLFFAFTGAKVHPRLGTQRRRLGKWLN